MFYSIISRRFRMQRKCFFLKHPNISPTKRHILHQKRILHHFSTLKTEKNQRKGHTLNILSFDLHGFKSLCPLTHKRIKDGYINGTIGHNLSTKTDVTPQPKARNLMTFRHFNNYALQLQSFKTGPTPSNIAQGRPANKRNFFQQRNPSQRPIYHTRPCCHARQRTPICNQQPSSTPHLILYRDTIVGWVRL